MGTVAAVQVASRRPFVPNLGALGPGVVHRAGSSASSRDGRSLLPGANWADEGRGDPGWLGRHHVAPDG